METEIAKWGNSLALRLPRHVVLGADLKEGTPVRVEVREGQLVITPTRKKFKLAELLAQMTPDTKHGETNWGAPQGDEVW